MQNIIWAFITNKLNRNIETTSEYGSEFSSLLILGIMSNILADIWIII